MSSRNATLSLRETLAEALPERPFRVELWDGSSLAPSNGVGGPTFNVRSPRALAHLLRAPSQLGLGRAYVSGEIDVSDMDAVLDAVDDIKAGSLISAFAIMFLPVVFYGAYSPFAIRSVQSPKYL